MDEHKIYFSDGVKADDFTKRMILSGVLDFEERKPDAVTDAETFWVFSKEREIFVEIDVKVYGYQVVSVVHGEKAREAQELIQDIQCMEIKSIQVPIS